jgi:hypothetical protein
MADLDEAGIEAGDRFEQMLPYGRATIEVERWLDDERVAVLRDTGARQVFPASTLLNENYWRRLSLSRVGSVAVEDVRALLKDSTGRRRCSCVSASRPGPLAVVLVVSSARSSTGWRPSSLVRPRIVPSSPSLTCWAASHPQNPKRRRKTNAAPEEATFDGGESCAMCPQR